MFLLKVSLGMLLGSLFMWGCVWATQPNRPPEADGLPVDYAEGYRRAQARSVPFVIAGSLLGILIGGLIVLLGLAGVGTPRRGLAFGLVWLVCSGAVAIWPRQVIDLSLRYWWRIQGPAPTPGQPWEPPDRLITTSRIAAIASTIFGVFLIGLAVAGL